MHSCIQFVHRFLIAFTMLFLSKIQMCCSAETLKMLISHLFLQCFMKPTVKVVFFKTRQSRHQIFLQNLSNLDMFSDRQLTQKSMKKNRHFRALRIGSHFRSVLDPILTQFWHRFWSFWGARESLGSHFGCPGVSQAASQGSAWLSWSA